MRHIVSTENMRLMDKRATTDLGISLEMLMETAGVRCADIIVKEYYQATLDGRVIIFCGKGNNGGDGLVIARHLYAATRDKPLVFMLESGGFSPETQKNYERVQKLGIPIMHMDPFGDPSKQIEALGYATLIIDAMYGTGFKGELDEDIALLINAINAFFIPIVSIDIPSGLNGNTGMGFSICAKATLAIGALKYGNIVGEGLAKCGKIHLIDLGFPPEFFIDIQDNYVYDSAGIVLPYRYKFSHKGDNGRVMLIGGSPAYPGSISLSARAALKSGAGLVYQYSRKEVLRPDPNYPEIICRAIPETEAGMPDSLAIKELLRDMDAVLIGPGLSTDAYAFELLKCVLENTRVCLVVDADAINLIARHQELQAFLDSENILLTPHLGEMGRLLGVKTQSIHADIIRAVKTFSSSYRCNLLLKTHYYTFANPESIDFIVAGNDALATGGSGDVLAGIIASFAAQGQHLEDAAIAGGQLLGKTAEKLALKHKKYFISPSDIIEHLGDYDD